MSALSFGVLAFAIAARAETPASAQTIWRLLDYIAVDYSAAVAEGQVISELEYTEMVEFAVSAATRIADLPAASAKAGLLQQAETLKSAIASKAATAEVSKIARALADQLLTAYPVPLAPAALPDLGRGEVVYAEQCASCHGVSGQGDGEAAQVLEPPPIDFTDRSRARERSLFGLYQVIEQGLDGTAMASYDWLPPEDRWALAFYIGGLAFSEDEAQKGQQAWVDDGRVRAVLPDLESLTQLTPSAVAQRLGEGPGFAVTAYLRRHPDAISASAGGLLAVAKKKLEESWQAYQSGDRQRAADLALSAYLDGFEPVEPILSVRDSALMRQIEAAMIELRSAVGGAAPTEDVESRIRKISDLMDKAEMVIATDQTGSGASFVGAFTILLREGLEALLIVVAMVAFLNKAGRPEVLGYVHAGWVGALAAGVLTWFIASNLISISGAGRELTEGIGSLVAAIVLVTVGIWMHGKSQAGAWQQYIKEKMTQALSRQSAWFLFLLAFIVVYREVFETILFFIALWSQGHQLAILAGAASAVAALTLCAWGLLNYSRRLPIAQFFLFSSVLIAVLAIVLAGKGIAALQEAGWLDVTTIAKLPRVEMVGFYPTWEGIVSQMLVLSILLAAFWLNGRQRLASTQH